MSVRNDLWQATTSRLSELYRSRLVSPVEVLEMQIAHVQEINDQANAVSDTDFDDSCIA